MSLVSLVRVVRVTPVAFKEAIERSLRLLNFNYRIEDKDIEKVVIKPNLCYYYDYSTGRTTDPGFIGALVDLLRERISSDMRIFVVESDASAMRCRYAFRMLGYEKMAREKGVALINLSEDKTRKIKTNPKHHVFNECHIPRTIDDADLLINVPVIKLCPHPIKISCALKNMYGCNPYPRKSKYHANLDETIVDLNKIMKPDLCIVDGIIANGPTPVKLGLVMASRDQVAIDAVASRIVGHDPEKVGHITLAFAEGMGNIHPVYIGDNLNDFKKRFSRRRLIRDFLFSKVVRSIYSFHFGRVV